MKRRLVQLITDEKRSGMTAKKLFETTDDVKGFPHELKLNNPKPPQILFFEI